VDLYVAKNDNWTNEDPNWKNVDSEENVIVINFKPCLVSASDLLVYDQCFLIVRTRAKIHGSSQWHRGGKKSF
jgi:hypothetical protein